MSAKDARYVLNNDARTSCDVGALVVTPKEEEVLGILDLVA